MKRTHSHTTSPAGKRLSARHERFVDEYLVAMNATQAAIRAGYSAKTAGQIGHRLLKNVEIAEAIEAKRSAISTAAGITLERILREMSAIAFADVRKLYDENGNLLPAHELPDDIAAVVASLVVSSYTPPGSEEPEYTTRIRLLDKRQTLERLLQYVTESEVEERIRAIEEKLDTTTKAKP